MRAWEMGQCLRVIMLTPLLVVVLFCSLKPAVADIPDVVGLSTNSIIDCGAPLAGRGFLVIVTVRHANPTAAHYVDKVEVMKGKVTEEIDLKPQSTEIFTVTTVVCEGRDYHAGQELTIQARAHCTIHGWGSWSSSVTVPEFAAPTVAATVALILVGLITSLARPGQSRMRPLPKRLFTRVIPRDSWHLFHK
jgi:desulfoferrodoxin (superoxide reductase-like protein)